MLVDDRPIALPACSSYQNEYGVVENQSHNPYVNFYNNPSLNTLTTNENDNTQDGNRSQGKPNQRYYQILNVSKLIKLNFLKKKFNHIFLQ